jgi:hypothetical protein
MVLHAQIATRMVRMGRDFDNARVGDGQTFAVINLKKKSVTFKIANTI